MLVRLHRPLVVALLFCWTGPVASAQTTAPPKSTPPQNDGIKSSSAPSRAAAGGSFDQLSRSADAAREAGRLDDAVALYQRALKLRPQWVEGTWYLGTSYYQLEKFGKAREAFDAVTQKQPLNAPAWGFSGLCKFQLKDYEGALVALMKAREIGVGPNKELAGVVRYHAGILLTRFEQFEYAMQILTEFAVEGNDNPKIIEAMGMAALRVPSLPEGLPESRREQVLLAGRGAYYITAHLLEPARRSFEELVAKYSDAPNVHYAYGVFLLLEEPDKAIEQFKKELELSPGHLASTLQIAFEYIKRSDWEAARPWAESAVLLAPGGFPGRQAYGQVLLELGDTKAAIEQLEAGVKLAPDAPSLHFALARAYQKAGRPEDAERQRTEFMRLQRQSRASQHGSQAVGGDDSPQPADPVPPPQ
jgi:tetratricopeptide (TPR) repeat protein